MNLSNRLRTAKRAVDQLYALLDGGDPHMASRDIPSSTNYTHLRTVMIEAAGSEIVQDAVQETGQNLRNAEAMLVREGVAVNVDSDLRRGYLLNLVQNTVK